MKRFLFRSTIVLAAICAIPAIPAQAKVAACHPQSLVGTWACDASCTDRPGKIEMVRAGDKTHAYTLQNDKGETSPADMAEHGKMLLAWNWHTGSGKGPSIGAIGNCATTITWAGGVRWVKKPAVAHRHKVVHKAAHKAH